MFSAVQPSRITPVTRPTINHKRYPSPGAFEKSPPTGPSADRRSQRPRRGLDPAFVRQIRAFNEANSAARGRKMPQGKNASSRTGQSSRAPPPPKVISESTKQLKDEMVSFLSRRYSTELKLLDLSALRSSQSEFTMTGTFETPAQFTKFFAALMRVCEESFETDEQRREAVISVRLANNNLPDLRSVSALPTTFPDLKNLDLSNNDLKTLDSICIWRPRLPRLEHLILSGNSLEAKFPDYEDAVFKRIPTVQILNEKQRPVKKASAKFAFPVSKPRINDPTSVGVDFIKFFIPAYDNDRNSLTTSFYDSDSQFSLNIITRARRAKETANTKSAAWDHYIKFSRNLTKLKGVSAKCLRVYRGTDIRDVWMLLPSTRHPDLITEGDKWCIEIEPLKVPGVNGELVTGLQLIIHGEFSEVDVSTYNITAMRSFDRNIIIGPGSGPGGVRVVSDKLTLRGHCPIRPAMSISPNTSTTATNNTSSRGWDVLENICKPEGWGGMKEGKPEATMLKEQSAFRLSLETGMTLGFSGQCLAENEWDLEAAYAKFFAVKESIPSEGWMKRDRSGRLVGSSEVEEMMSSQGCL